MTRSARKSYRNTGPTLPGMEISEPSMSQLLQGLILLQGECLANHTPWPENGKHRQTSEISGENLRGLFASLSHAGCWLRTYWAYLAQKIIVSMEEYSETWPRAGMMRNGLCYRLPSSERHTYGNASSLWRTPQAHDGKSGISQQGYTMDLTHQVLWPTPKATQRGGIQSEMKRHSPDLHAVVKMWPTPTAIDAGSGRINKSVSVNAKERPTLAMMARKNMWPTPAAQDGKNASLPPSQATRDTLPGALVRPSQQGWLNPEFVEMLQGFPPGWTDIDGQPDPINPNIPGNLPE